MRHIFGLGLMLVASVVWAQDVPKPTVVVAAIKAPASFKGGAVLTEELRTQVARHGAYRLVTPEEMTAVDAELQRQLEGGCEEASCVSELGGALGAQFVVTGQIGALGDRYSLNVKLVEIATVAARQAASVQAGSAEDFIQQMPNLVTRLLGARKSAGRSNAGAGWGVDADAEGERLLESSIASDNAFGERQSASIQASKDRMLEGSGNRTPGASCASGAIPPLAVSLLALLGIRRCRREGHSDR